MCKVKSLLQIILGGYFIFLKKIQAAAQWCLRRWKQDHYDSDLFLEVLEQKYEPWLSEYLVIIVKNKVKKNPHSSNCVGVTVVRTNRTKNVQYLPHLFFTSSMFWKEAPPRWARVLLGMYLFFKKKTLVEVEQIL